MSVGRAGASMLTLPARRPISRRWSVSRRLRPRPDRASCRPSSCSSRCCWCVGSEPSCGSFAYLQNGVLVAAFLGLGLGFRSARKPARLLPAVLVLFSVVFMVRDPLRWDIGEGVTQGLVAFQDSGIWYAAGGQAEWPQYVRTALLFYSVAVSLALLAAIAYVFRPLGQWLGAWMDAYPRPIPAYTANILGSLLGIGLFVVATVAVTRPFSLAGGRRHRSRRVCGVVRRRPNRAGVLGRHRPGSAAAPVERAWHDSVVTLPEAEHRTAGVRPGPTGPGEQCGESHQRQQRRVPVHGEPGPAAHGGAPRPLSAGRGSHLPLRVALRSRGPSREGARSSARVPATTRRRRFVRARSRCRRWRSTPPSSRSVEAAIPTGRTPQAGEIAVDDARAFFRRPSGPYDLVWFGLLDSHTTPSAYANVRLDHFVYTQESFADMKRLLGPSGVVVLLFAPQTEWIAARLVGLLTRTFGEAPVAMHTKSSSPCLGWGGLLLVGGSPEAMSGRSGPGPRRARAVRSSSSTRARSRATRTRPRTTGPTSTFPGPRCRAITCSSPWPAWDWGCSCGGPSSSGVSRRRCDAPPRDGLHARSRSWA